MIHVIQPHSKMFLLIVSSLMTTTTVWTTTTIGITTDIYIDVAWFCSPTQNQPIFETIINCYNLLLNATPCKCPYGWWDYQGDWYATPGDDSRSNSSDKHRLENSELHWGTGSIRYASHDTLPAASRSSKGIVECIPDDFWGWDYDWYSDWDQDYSF